MTEDNIKTLVNDESADHKVKKLFNEHKELDFRVNKLAKQYPMTGTVANELQKLKSKRARLKAELYQLAAAV